MIAKSCIRYGYSSSFLGGFLVGQMNKTKAPDAETSIGGLCYVFYRRGLARRQ